MANFEEYSTSTVIVADELLPHVAEETIHPDVLTLELQLQHGLLQPEDLHPTLQSAYERLRNGAISRREFLRIATAVLVLPHVMPLVAQAQAVLPPPTLPNGVASGDTTQTSTVLWARSTVNGAMRFDYGTDQTFAITDGSITATVEDTTRPVKAFVGNLRPGTQYFYRATDAAGNSTTGTFRTPRFTQTNTVPSRAGFRLGVAGDWRGELSPYPAISNAPGRNLDLFVLHGDTIYSDFPSPAVVENAQEKPQALSIGDFRAKHSEVYGTRFNDNVWARLRASTSVLVTIDDHEVVNDFAGGAARASEVARVPIFAGQTGTLISDTDLYKNGMQAFQEYNPVREEFYGETGDPRTANRRKLYRYRTYGSDAAVFVLDTRSFRDAPVAPLTNFNDTGAIFQFLNSTFTPGRTLLGRPQLDELKNDLLASQRNGILWKFVLVPEPIQNLGPLAAQDRFEGYAAERTELLKFITDNNIRNVVFVAADIHGTVINNVTYQNGPLQAQIQTGAFEVTTGSVAFDAPFGPVVFGLATQLGVATENERNEYATGNRQARDQIVTNIINRLLGQLSYDPIGLLNSPVNATLITGGYVAVHTYGWTEFEVAPGTGVLTVRTYGIDPYTRAELEANPTAVTTRTPQVVSEFIVLPQQTPASSRVFVPSATN